ncbi:hypothetical protein K491DRAFT_699232 [Lophiostoma macrostomum CBS 122681]|uniref:VASt domain-containing protein n=1 Tax=Lophiostoma macrostomum CBS 122681 TaxID=1314788 RepID=A0A6A6SM06_9PLEO|nr:hypothetical protein K491DRAFT_699232 [Lophiostoma macrostomum CBS 122681]
METAVERRNSQTSRRNSLAAPNGLLFSKGGIGSSATSIASSDNDMKSSTDGALDRLKSRGSEDGNSEGSSHRRRMSKLFKKKSKRRKSEDGPQMNATDDIPPVPAIRADPASESVDSLGLHKSVASSLLTEDSDAESPSPVPVRPGISPHQSHAGYLTLSSPLIASETIDSAITADGTLDDSATPAEDTLTPKHHAQTFDVGSDIKRSASPVGRLKEAFSPQRRSTSPKASVETDSSRPGTSGGGLGALFGKRRGSRGSDGPVILQASPPQIHEGIDIQSTPNLPSSAPKRIITQIPATPPSTTDAPTTFVTPPTPTDPKPSSPTGSAFSFKTSAKHGTSQSNPNVVVSPSGNMISHRRVRSATNPPSKLSNSTIPPLTPTIEEAKTPGGTAFAPQSPSGFFSSVFSAAQNAANTLSTTIANTTTNNKVKGGGQQQHGEDQKTGGAGGEEVIGPETADSASEDKGTVRRRPAVETLGSGDLSLSHLGISESTDPSPMSSAVNLARTNDDASAKAEDMAAAQAVSAAYAAPAIPERPRSLTANSAGSNAAGAMSPPRQPEILDSPAASSIQRQGSIRSRISGGRKRRHRGSSATTGNTISAAIGASTMTLVPQATMSQANVSGQRLNGTGFAVASPKRNRDFHNLFKSVPEDDYLIEDYSAALQKEILLHGRLYVSEGHLCFSSNILGWVTNLVISFDEVVSVEKKSTAMLFPNGIVIQTLHARNIFASFLSRDSTYDLIIGIWKISHPNLKSSLNGVALDGSAGTGDKTEKADSVASDDASLQDSDDEVYDEDAEEEEGLGSFTEAGEGSVAGSEQEPVVAGESRKTSQAVAQAVSGGPSQLSEKAEEAINSAPATQDYPGPASHVPTECGDAAQHYDKLLIDTTIPAPLGKVYSLMFGPASGVFMRKWLTEEKNSDLQMEDDKKGLGEGRKTFTFSYIKPLYAPVGPKQTKCNISMTLEQFDLDRVVSVLCSTATPDVPSGGSFLTKTRYCLMWGPGNSTRVIMTFAVEWSAKSWLKGPIEKGANDGQISYANSIVAALKATISSKAPSKAPGKPGKGKRRTKTQGLDETIPAPAISGPVTTAAAKDTSWGLFEPVRAIFGPIADILGSIIDAKMLAGIFFILLIWTWFFRSPSHSASLTHPYTLTPAHRMAAYEQIWQAEEAELWRWMEERVALDRVHQAAGRVQHIQNLQERLKEESMTDRQVDEAIRVTEERLLSLKRAVGRERGSKGKTENETGGEGEG